MASSSSICKERGHYPMLLTIMSIEGVISTSDVGWLEGPIVYIGVVLGVGLNHNWRPNCEKKIL